jgi:electron transfer flavoprotein alpha subunit
MTVGDILVFLESSGEERIEINKGLLTEGHRLAESLSGNLRAIVVGQGDVAMEILEDYGACCLYHVESDDVSDYCGETFSWALAEAAKSVPFRLFLFAHSDRGSDLAPRVAFHLGTVAVSDCIDIVVRAGSLYYLRYVYGDQLEQEVSYASQSWEVASWRPDFLDKREIQKKVSLEVQRLRVDVPVDMLRTKITDILPPDYRTVDILHARRIIGVGAGCTDPEVLGMIEELSHLLEGSLGTTRPVVDEGILAKDRMIGQTGKTISPEAYLALGISGSPHHVAGIQRSKTILSVNRDPRAPIFAVADAGFVCDLKNLLPKLIDRIKQYRDSPP